MLNLLLLLDSTSEVEDKAGVSSFLFHCIFPLWGLLMRVPEHKWLDASPTSARAHRRRASENVPCMVLTLTLVLAPWEASLVHSGFRAQAVARAIRDCGTQDTRAEYLAVPLNVEMLMGSSVEGWCLRSATIYQQGETDDSWPLFGTS